MELISPRTDLAIAEYNQIAPKCIIGSERISSEKLIRKNPGQY